MTTRGTFIHSSFAGSYTVECEILKEENNKCWIKYMDPIAEEETHQWISKENVNIQQIHRDFFGNILSVGDTVAFCEPKYRNLIEGKVIALTPQKVRVEYLRWNSKNTNYIHPQS